MIQVLRDGAWHDVEPADLLLGETFRVVIESKPQAGGMSANPTGSDTFIAAADGYVDDEGNTVVQIEKPFQSKFAYFFIEDLRQLGMSVQVKGAFGTNYATGNWETL